MDLRYYMTLALRQAALAAAAGEVPVGAVLVVPAADAPRLFFAANATEAQNSSLAHAELLALHQATQTCRRRYFEDATLFVTMEPCPACAGAVVLARVGRVVYGCPDSRWGACGSIFNVPEHPASGFRPQLIGGVMEEECRSLLQSFFRDLRTDGKKEPLL